MPDSTSVSKPFERLPVNVLPVHYNISFRPDLQKLVFEGHETIKVEVKNETSVVVLNVLELQVKLACFTREGGLEQNATNIEVSQDDERLILTFGQPLTVGKGELYLEFSGVLNEKMKGFYRSKYMSLEGEVRYAAVTQFEPTDARRALPCWDEPALKATLIFHSYLQKIWLLFQTCGSHPSLLSFMPQMGGEKEYDRYSRTHGRRDESLKDGNCAVNRGKNCTTETWCTSNELVEEGQKIVGLVASEGIENEGNFTEFNRLDCVSILKQLGKNL
ncbi:puromycin-sensitive aminopeptidase-like protein [Tachypleus tridentatus]|uniref:puromycin-sensitive aminopeptidase-like protein n=1 Tax=Tachypleus tridentatus TaxID=6853 RepID=UPI003FCF885F